MRDGFTTCFVTDSTLHLESSIIDCFSEEGLYLHKMDELKKDLAQAILISGEWLLDIACGSRQLSVAALERGRFF